MGEAADMVDRIVDAAVDLGSWDDEVSIYSYYAEPVRFKFDKIVRESKQAWLVQRKGKEFWLPKGKCELKEKEFMVPRWLFHRVIGLLAIKED